VAATGSPEEVFTNDRVMRLYGVALRVVHTEGRHAIVPLGGKSAIGDPRSPISPGGAHD
jgi:ABC-type cobalamin/Fe3+-siderophores transport system ATPase subunit